jgi:asparagine synthase (glutamine-hydrolysing)
MQNGYFAFASEAKALLTLPWVRRELDPEALDTYLSLGYSSGEKSMFRGLRRVPPATALVLEAGELRQRRYWMLPTETDQTRSAADWAEGLRAQLEQSVRAQMVSDVPLGAFLSGGIDSSAVVAMMARASDRPVKTYSIGFGDVTGGRLYNELPYARTVAELFRTDHREILVSPDVATLLPKLIWHLDEPLADAAFITTYLVSQFAREDVTVILSGVGGDELFGGYSRYLDEIYHRRYRLLPRALRQVIGAVASRLPVDRHSALRNKLRLVRAFVLASEHGFEDRYAAYVSVFGPQQLRRLRDGTGSADAIADAFVRASGSDYLRRLLDVDMQTQLPDDLLMLTDRMSMAVSLECRVPLLDTPLVEMAARMPARVKIQGSELKSVLKASLEGILPHGILHRQKRGFGAPVGAWLRQELRPLLDHCLNRRVVEARGLLRWDEVARTIELHMSSREDHTDHLLSLVNLELWTRIHLDGVEPDALARELPSATAP